MNDSSKPLSFYLGVLCFVASLATLVFQQQLGAIFGNGVMVLWLALGGLGIYFITKDQDNGPYTP